MPMLAVETIHTIYSVVHEVIYSVVHSVIHLFSGKKIRASESWSESDGDAKESSGDEEVRRTLALSAFNKSRLHYLTNSDGPITAPQEP